MNRKEIKSLLQKSVHAFKVAEILLSQGFPADAVSKIYYALFYAAQALLKNAKIEVTKHSAVESSLGFHFVRSGIIDQKYHRFYIKVRKLREIADYHTQENIIYPEAAAILKEAKEFYKLVKQILKKNL